MQRHTELAEAVKATTSQRARRHAWSSRRPARDRGSHAARQHPGHPGGADLLAGRRLSQAPAGGHRRSRGGRPGARRDRHAGSRPAARPGPRGRGLVGGEPRPEPLRAPAGARHAPAQPGHLGVRAHQPEPLAGPAGAAPGGAAGRGRPPDRVRREPGRRGRGAGQRGGAPVERDRGPGQRGREPRQRAAPARAPGLPARARALRGGHHGALRGRGRADRGGQHQRHHPDVPPGPDRDSASS